MLKKTRTPLLCLLGAFLIPASAGATQPFDTSETLEIEFSDQGGATIDQVAYFTEAVEQVFEKRSYPGEFEVDRWSGASQTDEGPLLDVRLILWEEWTPAEFQCRIYVTAISHGERHDLGAFVGRADALAPTRQQWEQRIIDSAADAMNKVYDRLQEEGLIER